MGQQRNCPWIVGGDFNEILYAFEKKWGIPRDERWMEGFLKVLESCGLKDIGYNSHWFTWACGNLPETSIRKCHDRMVANTKWFDMFPTVELRLLPHSYSDHCPIFLVLIIHYNHKSSNRFYFKAWWLLDSSFEKEVKRL